VAGSQLNSPTCFVTQSPKWQPARPGSIKILLLCAVVQHPAAGCGRRSLQTGSGGPLPALLPGHAGGQPHPLPPGAWKACGFRCREIPSWDTQTGLSVCRAGGWMVVWGDDMCPSLPPSNCAPNRPGYMPCLHENLPFRGACILPRCFPGTVFHVPQLPALCFQHLFKTPGTIDGEHLAKKQQGQRTSGSESAAMDCGVVVSALRATRLSLTCSRQIGHAKGAIFLAAQDVQSILWGDSAFRVDCWGYRGVIQQSLEII